MLLYHPSQLHFQAVRNLVIVLKSSLYKYTDTVASAACGVSAHLRLYTAHEVALYINVAATAASGVAVVGVDDAAAAKVYWRRSWLPATQQQAAVAEAVFSAMLDTMNAAESASAGCRHWKPACKPESALRHCKCVGVGMWLRHRRAAVGHLPDQIHRRH